MKEEKPQRIFGRGLITHSCVSYQFLNAKKTAWLIILGPILAPLAIDIGVHPLHFGIMMCVNLYIALITPPMGGCLFLAMAISQLRIGQILKELWPFLLIEFFVLFLVVYVPEITMFIPRILGFV